MGDELIDKGVEIRVFGHSFGAIADSIYSLLREADTLHYFSAFVCADCHFLHSVKSYFSHCKDITIATDGQELM